MTVKDLITMLQALPNQDMQVLTAGALDYHDIKGMDVEQLSKGTDGVFEHYYHCGKNAGKEFAVLKG